MNDSAGELKSAAPSSDAASRLIEALRLMRHPEGGWYRETWRSAVAIGERAAGTAILFLLEDGQRSQWHRVDADELWLWHAGSALSLRVANDDGSNVRNLVLGPHVLSGQDLQALVPAGAWQTATATQGWALVSCVVVPGFEFAGFTMAAPEWNAHLDAAIPTEGGISD